MKMNNKKLSMIKNDQLITSVLWKHLPVTNISMVKMHLKYSCCEKSEWFKLSKAWEFFTLCALNKLVNIKINKAWPVRCVCCLMHLERLFQNALLWSYFSDCLWTLHDIVHNLFYWCSSAVETVPRHVITHSNKLYCVFQHFFLMLILILCRNCK